MAFKDLFIVNDDDDKKKESSGDVQKTFKNKFPTSGPIETPKKEAKSVSVTPTQTMAAITPDNPACTPHLDNIMKLYEDGFDGLDMEGYDFYEYFQMVVEAGINNAAAYSMAFTMGKTMGASKESLVSQAQYYIDEINKVHGHYVSNGTTKKESALKNKGEEEANLNGELSDINAEIARLTTLKEQKESALSTIDAKYSPQLTDIECKLMANDMARERILGTINTVVKGINTNL